MPLFNLRKHRSSDLSIVTGLILLGTAVVLGSTTSSHWGVSKGLVGSQAERLAVLNGEIKSLQKKFLEAELRGIQIDRLPRNFLSMLTEREALVERLEYAENRPQRYAARVRYAGLAVMAAGVALFFASRLRRRSTR